MYIVCCYYCCPNAHRKEYITLVHFFLASHQPQIEAVFYVLAAKRPPRIKWFESRSISCQEMFGVLASSSTISTILHKAMRDVCCAATADFFIYNLESSANGRWNLEWFSPCYVPTASRRARARSETGVRTRNENQPRVYNIGVRASLSGIVAKTVEVPAVAFTSRKRLASTVK